MAEYIEREAFLAEQRHLYCENCARRKGMKNGKMRFVYEIGDAPCRACGYGDVMDDAEDFPAADVRPAVRGKWTKKHDDVCYWFECSVCGQRPPWNEWGTEWQSPFCPNCGADMREES